MGTKSLNKFLSLGILSLSIIIIFHNIAVSGSYTIKNATIVTVTGATIENGVLVIEGDKITAIGTEVKIPSAAEVIDAQGLFVYPGLIDAFTTLGLSEIGAVRATQDAYEMGTYNPHIKALVAINPHSVHIPISRVNGITTVLVAPGGSVISGQCALINLNGWTPEEMKLKAPVGICINFPRMPREDDFRRREQSQQELSKAKERAERQLIELKEVFKKAKRYTAQWDEYLKSQKPPAPDKVLNLEALMPVIKKELSVLISVNAEKDIINAVEFVKELDLKAIFQGVEDGWKVASLLNENNIPVLVGPVLRSPGFKDPYDARFANAAVLNKAGVKIAFLTRSAADVRNLPYHAGTAAAFGLPKEKALKAVTIYPAEIFGVSGMIGSLETGKLANVIVTDGDPLEMLTQVKFLFIAGEKIPLESKHTRLYDKFRKRPSVNK
ncbi:MAG: amidohydrolase family protein [bacterium]|nr:MAG: amidohydrolase family protein [bacterium]